MSERLIDQILELVNERGSLTADEASRLLGQSNTRCCLVLNKLFRNWCAIERRIEKRNGKNVPVFYKKGG